MARKNRYTGILQPRQVGVGPTEVAVVLIYDVEEDRLRKKIADECKNYGLTRIQYSAFMGKINRNHRQELCLKIQNLIEDKVARIHVFPIQEDGVRDIWVLDQFTKKEDGERQSEATTKASMPKIRVLKLED